MIDDLNDLKKILRHRVSDIGKATQAAICRCAGMIGRNPLSRERSLALIRQEHPGYQPGQLAVIDPSVSCAILRWGVVRHGSRDCLDLDYGSRASLAGWFGSSARVDQAAALWSHPWMGYYHWIIDVAPKIAQLQDRYGMDLAGWKLCYPKENTPYEKETLELLGVPESAVIDTRQHRFVRAGRVAMTALPGWFEIQPAAALLRSRLIDQAGTGSGKKIYVSRSGRRKCLNEREVFTLLARRGFVFVEDKPRSLAGQMGIFKNAKVIVAPHGAALTNLLWCEESTRVIELFGETYQPPYYRNLSAFRSLDYHKLGADTGGDGHWSEVHADLTVDLVALESLLDQMNIL